MSELLTTISGVLDPKLSQDDNRIDRVNHHYTSIMLVVFAVLVSTSQYVGKPIECWAPVHFQGEQVEYANSYCWISGTFHLPFNSTIPKTLVRYSMTKATYYQWVPAILLLQAALFNLPCLLWRSLSSRSGLDINSLIITGHMMSTVQMTKPIRDGLIHRMVLQIDRYLNSFHIPKLSMTMNFKLICSRTRCLLGGQRRHSKYLLSLYIISKTLYLLNAVGQFFALEIFLGHDYYLYGVEVVKATLRGDDWTGSYRFPRVNLCDFRVRRMGNIHQHTLQCVLPINLFNEKIFLFLWFWLIAVALLTFTDLLFWSLSSFVPRNRTRFIKRHLMRAGDISVADRVDIKQQAVLFTERYLCQDGVFLLRLFQESTNHITTMEFTSNLWNFYLKNVVDISPSRASSTSNECEQFRRTPTSFRAIDSSAKEFETLNESEL